MKRNRKLSIVVTGWAVFIGLILGASNRLDTFCMTLLFTIPITMSICANISESSFIQGQTFELKREIARLKGEPQPEEE